MRVQADDARLEVDVPPLHRQYFTWDAPSGDVGKLHSRADRRRQVSEDAIDLLPLEEACPHVPFLEHRNVRHVRQFAVLSRQVEDALQCRQLAIDLAVRDTSFLTLFTLAERDHVGPTFHDERVDVRRLDRRQPSATELRQQMQANPALQFIGRAAAVHGVFGLQIVRCFVKPNSIQLRVHRQPAFDVAFADLEQPLGVGLFGLPVDSRIERPFR